MASLKSQEQLEVLLTSQEKTVLFAQAQIV
jgi:hypothetical protein